MGRPPALEPGPSAPKPIPGPVELLPPRSTEADAPVVAAELLLRIDSSMKARLGPLDPLFDVPVNACEQAEQTPLACGFAEACDELGHRWARQLSQHLGPMPGLDDELATRRYPERCDGPLPSDSAPDFVAHAAEIRYILELVEGLLVRTPSGWRGRARLSERIVDGMGKLVQHHPIAAWQLNPAAVTNSSC